MIERRRDQIAVARQILAGKPHLHDPDMALVRQHDALRDPGRTGGVEKHRRLVPARHDRPEGPAIDEGVERLVALCAETDHGWTRRAVRAARGIAEHQLRAGILDDEMNGLARKLEIHRHRDQTRPHDAEIGGEIFGAIGGQYRDALAAREAARQQGARDAVRRLVERPVAEFARSLPAAEVDDRDLVEVAVAADQVAEVLEMSHG